MIRGKPGRKRLTAQEQAWSRIHDPLSDILLKMVHYKTNKGYAKVAYGGYMQELRKCCIRIINNIDWYLEIEKKTKKEQV